MPERLEKLRATVRELEQELSELGTLDAESRELLEDAAAEIQATLAVHDLDVPRTTPDEQPISERLAEAARSFESSHPTLAGVVHKLVDALGQLGI